MNRQSLTGQRLAALAALGLLLFNTPLLALAGRHPTLVGDLPLLVLYLFGTWLALILLLALVAEGRHDD